MKKLLFTPMALLCIFCISCNNNSGGMSETAKKNLEANHAIQKMFETKDFSKCGTYIAQDGVNHAGMMGDVKGLDSIKADLEKMAAMTENDKSEIIKELADDEYVMSWGRYTGTCKIAGMGYKVGDKVDMTTIEVSKYKDGKATEHWSFVDMAEMMKMMGAAAPPMSMPADSTTKDTMGKK